MPGWRDSVRKARDRAALPAAFKDYVRAIEDLIETKVAIISTGVEREDTIFLEPELRGLVDLESLEAGD